MANLQTDDSFGASLRPSFACNSRTIPVQFVKRFNDQNTFLSGHRFHNENNKNQMTLHEKIQLHNKSENKNDKTMTINYRVNKYNQFKIQR